MFKTFAALVMAGAFATMASAETVEQDHAHSSQNALDWPGKYEGVLPCASCPGLKTELELKVDGSYILTETYLEKSEPLTSEGTFAWDEKGANITLKGEDESRVFKVGERFLLQYDAEGKLFEGELAERMTLTQVD